MSLAAFGIVLFAALLHASWNAIIKSAGNATYTTMLVALMAGVVGIVSLPFLPTPHPASWPFLAASTVLQTLYYLLVAGAYRAADMSQAYPLMRGLAPLIVAIFGALVLGEHLGPLGWLGVLLVCTGVVGIALVRVALSRGTVIALANAVVIAAYTLVDGTGVRLSGSPVAYTLLLGVLTAIPFLLWVLARERGAFFAYARRNALLGAAGGIATLAAYGLALWAMTEAPIAIVAALRETSILFGTLIAVLILRERVTAPRIAATLVIALGAMVLRMA